MKNSQVFATLAVINAILYADAPTVLRQFVGGACCVLMAVCALIERREAGK